MHLSDSFEDTKVFRHLLVVPRLINWAPFSVADLQEARNYATEQCASEGERNPRETIFPSTEQNWNCNTSGELQMMAVTLAAPTREIKRCAESFINIPI